MFHSLFFTPACVHIIPLKHLRTPWPSFPPSSSSQDHQRAWREFVVLERVEIKPPQGIPQRSGRYPLQSFAAILEKCPAPYGKELWFAARQCGDTAGGTLSDGLR